LSDIGEGIHEVTVKEWYVKQLSAFISNFSFLLILFLHTQNRFVEEGQVVNQFDNICEVQSDKASVTITSRYDGKITKLYYSVDDIALVGKPLVDFDVEDEERVDSESDTESSSSSSSSDSESELFRGKRVLTTPSVRKIAKENNVDLSKVRGTGRHGRILKGDVLEFLNLIPKGTQKPHPSLKDTPLDEFLMPPTLAHRTVISPLEHKIVPLKGVPKVMFKSMTEALKIPHFMYSEDVDMTKMIQVKNDVKAEADARGMKITYMPYMIKAASICLHKYPILNSSIDVEHESIIYKPYHNISVAIHTPMGLVVPNIKNVHEKSISQIAQDLNKLQERGLKNQLTPEDFSHGTFTLSNIGNIGGTVLTPVIMPPQVCIGALGRINVKPRFGPNGELIKAHIMNVSFSGDHRIIDGVTMSSFANLWKSYLEKPNLFTLDG
jgi:2-oxoisovalerate dehydrogenase E2 component (dihydrolipoyl transacylase)